MADTESEATWQELFRSLQARGLTGVQLVISDDHAGLRQAIRRDVQGANWQRCQMHVTRTLLGQAGRSQRADLDTGLRTVFAATSREDAVVAAHRLADAWRRLFVRQTSTPSSASVTRRRRFA